MWIAKAVSKSRIFEEAKSVFYFVFSHGFLVDHFWFYSKLLQLTHNRNTKYIKTAKRPIFYIINIENVALGPIV